MWDQTYAYSELPDDEETAEEVEFISRVLDLGGHGLILDLCCGQGRHSIKLANMGYSVIGLDSSKALLDMAKSESLKNSARRLLWFVEGDMRSLPIRDNTCDAVINLFTSFGFFDDAENIGVLRAIADVLKPGGKLLLDYWNPYIAVQLDGTRNWWWVTENLLTLAEVRCDFPSGRLQDIRTLINIEKSSMENAVRNLRLYTLPELEKMLTSVGLRISKIYGDIDERDYDSETRRLITVSEKVK